MGLEIGNYIGDLSPSNPIGTDARSQGDDHLRLIKSVLQSTFPSATKEFYFPTATDKAANFNVAIADEQSFFPVDASGGAVTATLPAGTGLNAGYKVTVCKTDGSANAVTIATTGGDTINGRTTWVLNDPYSGVDLWWTGSLFIAQPWAQEGVLATGDITFGLTSAAKTGFIKMNSTTIGSASSGATQRANADCERLFNFLWNNLADVVCPVSTGRGASAAADWTANKTIGSPDLRGRSPFGLDTMGGSAASRISDSYVTGGGGDSDTPGGTGGVEEIAITEAQMPSHTHSVTDPGHSHTGTSNAWVNGGAAIGFRNDGGHSNTPPTLSIDSATTGISIQNAGSDNAHNNLPPFMLGTWYQKL